MNKSKYITINDYIIENKNNIKKKPFSSLNCILNPNNSYDSLNEKIEMMSCSKSGLPLGISRIKVKNDYYDMPSIYSNLNKNTSIISPLNNVGEFAPYFIGGNDGKQKGKETWDNVGNIYCNSYKKFFNSKTYFCDDKKNKNIFYNKKCMLK